LYTFSWRSLLLLLTLLSVSAHAEIIGGRVLAVVDGDTLTLVDAANQQHTIHLVGIDAPEKDQAFGQKAKTNLAALAFGQQASADCRKRDRERHDICVVTVGGKDLGLEQVRSGMAWWYRQLIAQQTPEERASYEQAEFDAKTHRLGLWNSINPTPPWDWRHGRLAE